MSISSSSRQLPSLLRQPRFGASAVSLSSGGLILLLGGAAQDGTALEHIEMFQGGGGVLGMSEVEPSAPKPPSSVASGSARGGGAGSLVLRDWADVGGADLMAGRGRVLACCAAIHA